MTLREFVGRQAELTAFANFLRPPSTYRILAVSGIGGVGKSTLVEKFCEIARAGSHPAALLNARRLSNPDLGSEYPAAVEAMIALERSFCDAGLKLTELSKQLNRYKKLHSSLARKFAGAEGTAVGVMMKVGLSAIRAGATVFPMAAPLNEVLTPELATQVSTAIASYRRAADRRLLSDPVEELTTTFVRGLNSRASHDERRIVIVVDEFERVPIRVEYWLRALSWGDFGALEQRVLLVLSGRSPLDQDWTSRGLAGGPSEVMQLRLQQFSNGEVIEYLHRTGVDSESVQTIASSLGPTYRLPLVLRLLVADPGRLPLHTVGHGHLGLFADDLVGRILDVRETSQQRRDLALAMSVARRFDLSIVSVLLGEMSNDEARDGLQWLTRQDFIDQHAPAYTYHDLVRSVFIEHLQNTDRDLLKGMHLTIRRHYEQMLTDNMVDERSRAVSLEVAYHALSGGGGRPLTDALRLLFRFLPTAYEYGMEWSRAIGQVLAERTDYGPVERAKLERLSTVLEESWLLSVPSARPGAAVAADPAMNILFSSSFDDSLPTIDDHNAELWLSYLECRLRIVAGSPDDLVVAFDELRRIWSHRVGLENLLSFRVATDLADVHTRRNELAEALVYHREAVAIATAEGAQIWQAFALYQLGNDQKRQGAYQDALASLSAAIELMSTTRTDRSTRYYRGRFLLDQAITLTYLNDAVAAERSFEEARVAFAGSSKLSYAELSHRVGWLKRVRGDLTGALADHEAAIRAFEELDSGLHIPDGRTSAVSYLLAKALHSMGNVYAEMSRHADALRTYARAVSLFQGQGGVRHEAIVLKDRSWSRAMIDGYEAAEHDVIDAVDLLGPQGSQSERPAVNAATHLAEAWLTLARIRCCRADLLGARGALGNALRIIGEEVNPPLLAPALLQLAMCHALAGDIRGAQAALQAVSERATAPRTLHWQLAGRARLVEAVGYAVVGEHAQRDNALAESLVSGARWNEFERRFLVELWARLEPTMTAMTNSRATALTDPETVGEDQDEIIDIYDESGNSRGQASSRAAHMAGLWHRSFHCWIISRDPAGDHRVLLQRRGPFARSFPNLFDISVAGHYKAGEGVEGGVRECREELGIEIDPGALRQIARRIIDENLYNGTVNREFQDIYLLELDDPIDSSTIGYPEVSALVTCSLRGLLGVVTGDVLSIPYQGVSYDESLGRVTDVDGRLTQAELILEARAYHQTVFALIGKVVDSGVDIADLAGAAQSEVSIADRSRWISML
ncbi:AAA family ATPase [Micromonospora sp. NPDC005710]|uniref:AAA family ATPase n=1 Tax=Micromonospora sp. NPDC005710 TaxID=3157051 RepID=UPI0033CDCE35